MLLADIDREDSYLSAYATVLPSYHVGSMKGTVLPRFTD